MDRERVRVRVKSQGQESGLFSPYRNIRRELLLGEGRVPSNFHLEERLS